MKQLLLGLTLILCLATCIAQYPPDRTLYGAAYDKDPADSPVLQYKPPPGTSVYVFPGSQEFLECARNGGHCDLSKAIAGPVPAGYPAGTFSVGNLDSGWYYALAFAQGYYGYQQCKVGSGVGAGKCHIEMYHVKN